MFRWPVSFTPLSLGGGGVPRETMLEVTPRGALFTLACLSHVGHPAHLALIDSYLKGQVATTPTSSIGEDSRTVAASLALPLIAAYELGLERISLADLILLPRDVSSGDDVDRAPDGRPVRSPDCARLLLRAGDRWHWVRGAERFPTPGCLGTREVGQTSPWHEVFAELKPTDESPYFLVDCPTLEISVEHFLPTAGAKPPNSQVRSVLREISLARFSYRWSTARHYAERLLESNAGSASGSLGIPPLTRGDLLYEPLRGLWVAPEAVTASDPGSLVATLCAEMAGWSRCVGTLFWRGLQHNVSLYPEPDRLWMLYITSPSDADPASLFDMMRELAWEVIEGLIGRPLPERRTEPIELRLVGKEGRTTTLDVGASIVIGRNQTVFAAWVGSDGRVMIRLLPPGGMRGG